jgi:2-amino-4-hydroxy-6-hydroxymethyldihydropteridine diphosphokinase
MFVWTNFSKLSYNFLLLNKNLTSLATVFLSLGSNLGDREKNLKYAIQLIGLHAGKVIKLSSFYETASWGIESKNLYFNQVIIVDSIFEPDILIEKLLSIEKQLGRERLEKYRFADRSIDIDILFYDNIILETKKLLIPHPKIASRRFVLVPLNEIAHRFLHPVLKKTIGQLLIECEDALMVRQL